MYALGMMIRPALRAALVVSGLAVTAGCGGTATLREESSTSNGESSTTGSHTTTSNTVVATRQPCDPSAEPTSQACCEEDGGRMWDASSGTCVWMAVPGPFVPPSIIG